MTRKLGDPAPLSGNCGKFKQAFSEFTFRKLGEGIYRLCYFPFQDKFPCWWINATYDKIFYLELHNSFALQMNSMYCIHIEPGSQ